MGPDFSGFNRKWAPLAKVDLAQVDWERTMRTPESCDETATAAELRLPHLRHAPGVSQHVEVPNIGEPVDSLTKLSGEAVQHCRRRDVAYYRSNREDSPASLVASETDPGISCTAMRPCGPVNVT